MNGTLDTLGFLSVLFAALDPGEHIEIRPINGRVVGPRQWFADALGAARYALQLAPRWNVYCGVCPRERGGGKKHHVTRIPALWADLDDKCFPTGRAGALAALAGFPLPPSLTVDSGGGIQAYWLLAAPLAATEAGTRVEGLLARLYERLGGVDSVQDVSRVLRVAGTTNYKYSPPRPVTVLSCHDERRYTLAQFEALLPAPPPPARRPARHCAMTARPGVPAPEEIRDMLSYIPRRGDYRHLWITVLAAVHSAYPDATGISLCEEWSPGYRGEIERKFRSFGNYQGQNGPATIGTLVYLAKRHGWEPPARRVVRLTPKEAAHAR